MTRLIAYGVWTATLMPSVTSSLTSADPSPYLDPTLPIATRVADLLSRMTLDEKAAQLGYALRDTVCGLSRSQVLALYPHGLGGTPAGGIACSNAVQVREGCDVGLWWLCA